MSYTSYLNIADNIGIVKNDRIFVSSDAVRLSFLCYSHGEVFNANQFIDSIIKVIGDNGTLVFPTFNWGFCRGDAFDYCKTASKAGSLTNTALKRKDFKRTKHPIYSFAVWGNDTEALCSLNNKSSFGDDSPFAFFYKHGYKNLFIDVDYKNSATFVHYCEEKAGVSYRFLKDFSANYVDENGVCELRTYSMYVRPLDTEVTVTINPMHEVFLANNAVQEFTVNNIPFSLLDMRKAYDLVDLDIINNKSRNIATYDGQED
ncbi:MAG: AAC(3) family N-acetyltransferase [Synergistaceae bacterium]|nr:AAC(3) family N-acetyltransferase [Synergistaceae bacterium]